jgi:hypothetical protein
MNPIQKNILNKIQKSLQYLDLEIGFFNTNTPILKEVKALYLVLKLKESLNSFFPIFIKNTKNDNSSVIRLIDLIDKFYENRNTEAKHRIVLFSADITRDIGCDYLLKTQASDIWALKDNCKEKEQIYQLYYKELTDFADFIQSELIK